MSEDIDKTVRDFHKFLAEQRRKRGRKEVYENIIGFVIFLIVISFICYIERYF